MALNPKRKSELRKISLFVSVLIILLLAIWIPFIHSKAAGIIQSNFLAQACTNCAVTFPNSPALNDFIIVQISDGATTNLPSGNPTDTLGNTFVSVIRNNTQLGVAIYIAKQTHTAGADTVTVPFSGAQTAVMIGLIETNQLSSTTPSVSATGSGTSANPISVSSKTPTANDMCFGIASETGTTGASPEPIGINPMSVNFVSSNALTASESIGFAGINPSAVANTFQVSILKGLSATNTGSVLASLTKWDYAVGCFNEDITTTSTTTSTTTTTASTTVTSYSPTVTSTSYSPTVTLTTYNATATSYSPTVTSTSYSPTVTSTSIVSTVTSATATSTLYGNVQGYPNIVTFLIIAMVLFGGLFVVLRRRAGKTISTGIERLEG